MNVARGLVAIVVAVVLLLGTATATAAAAWLLLGEDDRTIRGAS